MRIQENVGSGLDGQAPAFSLSENHDLNRPDGGTFRIPAPCLELPCGKGSEEERKADPIKCSSVIYVNKRVSQIKLALRERRVARVVASLSRTVT